MVIGVGDLSKLGSWGNPAGRSIYRHDQGAVSTQGHCISEPSYDCIGDHAFGISGHASRQYWWIQRNLSLDSYSVDSAFSSQLNGVLDARKDFKSALELDIQVFVEWRTRN